MHNIVLFQNWRGILAPYFIGGQVHLHIWEVLASPPCCSNVRIILLYSMKSNGVGSLQGNLSSRTLPEEKDLKEEMCLVELMTVFQNILSVSVY